MTTLLAGWHQATPSRSDIQAELRDYLRTRLRLDRCDETAEDIAATIMRRWLDPVPEGGTA